MSKSKGAARQGRSKADGAQELGLGVDEVQRELSRLFAGGAWTRSWADANTIGKTLERRLEVEFYAGHGRRRVKQGFETLIAKAAEAEVKAGRAWPAHDGTARWKGLTKHEREVTEVLRRVVRERPDGLRRPAPVSVWAIEAEALGMVYPANREAAEAAREIVADALLAMALRGEVTTSLRLQLGVDPTRLCGQDRARYGLPGATGARKGAP